MKIHYINNYVEADSSRKVFFQLLQIIKFNIYVLYSNKMVGMSLFFLLQWEIMNVFGKNVVKGVLMNM